YGEGTVELTIRDSYRNMKEMVEPYPELLETAKAALKSHGVEPKVVPIRGGTDGARLSFLGLPCPNLCTGGYNYHGRFECIPVQSMEKMVEVLEEIIKRFAIE
ncbi:MAG: M20/M25/M40 family metallo-hydrolase, partial [Clostridiaceae bacterium]|nr:M20/M25/M40 family metallo-hydrolase [Clostridiaceae bacterium]